MSLSLPGNRRIRERPQLRTLETVTSERHASWLELFFDLVYVFAVSQVAVILATQTDWFGFLKYLALFLPVWYSWIGFTFYADRFESEETAYRVLTFAGMLAVTGFSLRLGGAFTGEGDTSFAVCFILVRIVLMTMYARAAFFVPLARPFCLQFIAGLAISIVFMLASIETDPPTRYVLWGIAQLSEFATPFLNLRITRLIPIDRSHIPERFGLFTIIVLGEAVVAAATGASAVEWNWHTVSVAAMGFGMAAGIWWINFEFVEDNAIRSNSLTKRFVYLYGHFLIVVSIVAAGIGVEHSIKETNSAHLHLSTLLLIAGGMAVYLSAVTMIRLITGICNLVWIRIAVIILSFAMIGAGNYLHPIAIIATLFLIMIAGIWIEGRFSDASEEEQSETPHIQPCAHESEATVFSPRLGIAACEECHKNNYKWVHLRLCLSCGHVGCCDSSRYKHATNHFVETGHPLMASIEPGETWAWCYVDERFVPAPVVTVPDDAPTGENAVTET